MPAADTKVVDKRDANLLAALSVAISDMLRDETDTAAGHGGAAPAALVALHEFAGGGTIDKLRHVLGLTPSGAVRLVDRLALDGLVERGPGTDNRSVAVALTPKGRRTATRVRAARQGAVQPLLASLSDADRTALRRASEALIGAIAQQRLEARQRGELTSTGWLCRLCDFAACGRPDGHWPSRGRRSRRPCDYDPQAMHFETIVAAPTVKWARLCSIGPTSNRCRRRPQRDRAAARWFDTHDRLKVVVVSGSGRAFSAGADGRRSAPTNDRIPRRRRRRLADGSGDGRVACRHHRQASRMVCRRWRSPRRGV
jgi:DNA-binding MarR family transcriptional regulator